MGTNYYHVVRGKPDRHIGKSSGGWCFALHVYPEDGINTLVDWIKVLGKGGRILNEYRERITFKTFFEAVAKRHWNTPSNEERAVKAGYTSLAHFHEANHSEPGPNNLLRSKVDGKHCIGHGDGTWDYIIGEFS